MRQIIYELYNTETETIEAFQRMSANEAEVRNTALRNQDQPQRWVPKSGRDWKPETNSPIGS